jgi:predicted amidohydrolase
MQNILRIALVQADLVWEAPEQNRTRFSEILHTVLKEAVDVVVLPEMFTSGFTMNPSAVAEPMSGPAVSWMKTMALQYDVAITGSLVIVEGGKYYNRLVFVTPKGVLGYYDKRHTFTLVGEGDVYEAGTEQCVIHYKGWNLCLLICYDLRFPVWSRNTANYDVLLYVANWPIPRITAWNILLQARAIENMCYSVGVNRVGVDGVGVAYSGNSGCYDVLGRSLTAQPLEGTTYEIVTLSKSHIDKFRRKFKFLDDKDHFNLLK